MSERLPLRGVAVLGLGRGADATAACVRLLAQLGATVRAHDARRAPAAVPTLARLADVTVTDLRPAEARRLGLDPARLGAPGRAVVSVTPFGLDSPDADRADPTAAAGGMDPLVADALAGAHTAVAALAALRWARRHGRAALAEVATLEVVAACLGDLLPRATCPRAAPGGARSVATDRGLAVLPCADGYVGLAAPSAVDRDLLAGLTGVDTVRAPNADLARALGPWLATRSRDAIFQAAQGWRLPVVPVLAPGEVYADAQCAARGVWAWQDGRLAARSPFRITLSPKGAAACSTAESVARGLVPRSPVGGSRQTAGDEPLSYDASPLADVRALDLGMVWAGPWCGRLLAGLGARVVKIEGPARRDGTRPTSEESCAGAFADLNRGKEGLALDLASAAGRAVFLRLAAGADVMLENFSPRVMPNFGLDHGALAQVNPRLLMLSMPAFGASGPWRDYVAYGSGLELATGLAAVVDGRPSPAPIAYLDYLAGAYGAAALLAALLARDRTGRGAHVEVAQREVACQLLATAVDVGRLPKASALEPAALRADPHLAARGLFAAPPVGAAPCHHYARLPWRLHGAAALHERPAPAFGADSRAVLRELAGLAPAEVEALVRDGVVVVDSPEGDSVGRQRVSTGARRRLPVAEGAPRERTRGVGREHVRF